MWERNRTCVHECIKINSFIFCTSPTSPPLPSLPPGKDKGQRRWAEPLKRSRFLYERINIQAYSLSVSVVRWTKRRPCATIKMCAVNFLYVSRMFVRAQEKRSLFSLLSQQGQLRASDRNLNFSVHEPVPVHKDFKNVQRNLVVLHENMKIVRPFLCVSNEFHTFLSSFVLLFSFRTDWNPPGIVKKPLSEMHLNHYMLTKWG